MVEDEDVDVDEMATAPADSNALRAGPTCAVELATATGTTGTTTTTATTTKEPPTTTTDPATTARAGETVARGRDRARGTDAPKSAAPGGRLHSPQPNPPVRLHCRPP